MARQIAGLVGPNVEVDPTELDTALMRAGSLVAAVELRTSTNVFRVGDFGRLAEIIHALVNEPSSLSRQTVVDLVRWANGMLGGSQIDDSLKRPLQAMFAAVANATRERHVGDGADAGFSLELDAGVLVTTFVREFGEIQDGAWRFFPYANVGYGYLWDTNSQAFRLSGYEELGFGFDVTLDPNVRLGGHIVASGLLLSVTDAHGAQDLIMLGLGPHLELYELVTFELFGGVMIPLQADASGNSSPRPTVGLSAQIPLYDYLEAVAEAASE